MVHKFAINLKDREEKMTKFLKNKSILVTGGTGSFGKAFIKKI